MSYLPQDEVKESENCLEENLYDFFFNPDNFPSTVHFHKQLEAEIRTTFMKVSVAMAKASSDISIIMTQETAKLNKQCKNFGISSAELQRLFVVFADH